MTAQPPRIDERRIRVLWNPSAGRKGGIPTNHSSREMLLDLMSRHGLGDELVEPSSEQEAIEAAVDAVDRAYDVVVAAGGDGTIGLVGRQLLGTPTALGILPFGSVMNIPRMLGLPRDPDAAADILADGNLRVIDVGQVGDRIFYEAGSVGVHAAATRELPLVDKGDYGALARSIAAAFRYRPSEMRIELDGDRTIVANAVGVAVANGPFMGPGVAVAPEALIDDGLFDVRVFLYYTKAELLRYVWSTVRGRRPQERRSLTERAGSGSQADDRSRRVPMLSTWDRPPSSSRFDRAPLPSSPWTHQRHRADRDGRGRTSTSPAVASRLPRRSRETRAHAATRSMSHSPPAR